MASQVKVVIIGSIGVGKSSLAIRYVYDDFNEHMQSTLGAVYFQKTHMHNNANFKYQFWDTAGQQKYRSIARIYYKDCKVALIVYDITRKQSFDSLKNWVEQLKTNGPSDLILAVVGNKIDLTEKQQVSYTAALEYANSIDAIFKLTSAKQNKGIQQLFDAISQRLIQKQQGNQNKSKKGNQLKNKKRKTQKSKCC